VAHRDTVRDIHLQLHDAKSRCPRAIAARVPMERKGAIGTPRSSTPRSRVGLQVEGQLRRSKSSSHLPYHTLISAREPTRLDSGGSLCLPHLSYST